MGATTLLRVACWDNNLAVVNVLLDAKADINEVKYSHRSVLEEAIYAGNAALVELLLARGAKTHSNNPHWRQYGEMDPKRPFRESYLYLIAADKPRRHLLPVMQRFHAKVNFQMILDFKRDTVDKDENRRNLFNSQVQLQFDEKAEDEAYRLRLLALQQADAEVKKAFADTLKFHKKLPEQVKLAVTKLHAIYGDIYHAALSIQSEAALQKFKNSFSDLRTRAKKNLLDCQITKLWGAFLFKKLQSTQQPTVLDNKVNLAQSKQLA